MNPPSESAPPAGTTPLPASSGEARVQRDANQGMLRHFNVALLVAVAALALIAWHWFDSRARTEMLREQLAKKLSDVELQARDSRLIADHASQVANELQGRVGVLESKLAESRDQQAALETLYQELSRNRDEWAYADIEQSLLIASQQLQLAGNVKAALIALQSADLRLQRMERPELTPLRKAINGDIERLKAVPYIDTVGLSVRLDNLISAIDTLPLAMELRPQPAPAAAAARGDKSPVWVRFWHEAWDDFRQLIRIQRMDRPEMPLIGPGQSFFLRQNLKLRLIGARLALLSRDQTSYRADLGAASEWLARYYDDADKSVAAALGALRALRGSEITIQVPDISATLEALRDYRLSLHERQRR